MTDPLPFRPVRAIATLIATTAMTLCISVSPAIAAPSRTDGTAERGEQSFTRVERAEATGERFQAGPGAAMEIMFSDGGSVTLAPGSILLVDEYRFDRADSRGVLAMKLERGAIRIMGGILNQKTPITLQAAAATLTLNNGGAFIALEQGTVRAALLVAGTLETSAGGGTETLSRPGFEVVVAAGARPGEPSRQPQGRAFADATIINPGLRSVGAPRSRTSGEEALAGKGVLDDENARRSLSATGSASAPYVTLPDGSILPTLTASIGPIASLGVSNLSDGPPDVELSQDNLGGRAAGLTSNRATLGRTYEYDSPGPGNRLLGPIQYSDICCYYPPSSNIGYFVDTTFILANPVNRDTVFALGVSPEIASQAGALPSATTLQAYALAVPYEYIFLDNNRINSGTLTRPPTIGNGNPIPADPASFNAFDQTGAVNVGISALTAGFLGFDDFIFGIDDIDQSIPLLNNPRSVDNFVSIAAEDVYGHVISFAAGDVSNLRNSADSPTIDSFVLTRGLNASDFQADGSLPTLGMPQQFRSLLPSAANFDGALALLKSTPLLAYNSGGSGDMISRLYMADLAVSADGTSSTVSGSFGRLSYRQDGLDDGRSLVTAHGRTIGSTSTAAAGPTLFSSPLIASAIGGGGAWDSGAGAQLRPGYASYVMLENVSNDATLLQFPLTPQGQASNAIVNGPALSSLSVADIYAGLAPLFDPVNFSSPPDQTPDQTAALNALSAQNLTLEQIQLLRGFRDFGNQPDFQAAISILNSPLLSKYPKATILSWAQNGPPYQTFDPISVTFVDIASSEAQEVDRLRAINLSEDKFAALGFDPLPLDMPALAGLSPGEITELAAGGTIAALGQSGSNYGLLRLASGVRSQAVSGNLAQARNAAAGAFAGFVAGLHQTAGSTRDGPYQGLLSLDLNASTGEVAAAISYGRPAVSAASSPYEAAGTILLGAAAPIGGESAYIMPGSFGAAVSSPSGASAALIAGDAVKDGLGTVAAAKIPQYEHIQWGFFFGDLLPQAGQRTHTALSTWVAGRRADANERIQGSASYAGHAIGSVIRQTDIASVYTSVGTFEQSWNLDARVGSMSMAFDGNSYSGKDLRPSSGGRPGLAYDGTMTNASGPILQTRIEGELVDVRTVGNLTQPQGTIGTFTIRGFDASYQAIGTFAGDIKR